MKKTLLLLSIIIVSSVAGHSQNIQVGAKAGVNFGQKGFHAGAVAEFPLSEKFSLQPEAVYSTQKKTEEISRSYSGEMIDVKGITKLDYINVPIIAKYYLLEGLAVEVGPHFGVLLSATGESELDLSNVDPDIAELIESRVQSGERDISDRIRDFDIGIGVGGSYTLDMGLFLGARVNFGLLNANNSKYSDEYDLKNNVFQVSLGYMF